MAAILGTILKVKSSTPIKLKYMDQSDEKTRKVVINRTFGANKGLTNTPPGESAEKQ